MPVCFLMRKKKKCMPLGWWGRWRGSETDLGRGTVIWIYCIKTIFKKILNLSQCFKNIWVSYFLVWWILYNLCLKQLHFIASPLSDHCHHIVYNFRMSIFIGRFQISLMQTNVWVCHIALYRLHKLGERPVFHIKILICIKIFTY